MEDENKQDNEEEREEMLGLRELNPKANYKEKPFADYYEQFRTIAEIKTDPDLPKARETLGEIVFKDKEKLSAGTAEEVGKLRDGLAAKFQETIFEHTQKNLEQMLEQTGEQGLLALLPGLPVKKDADDDVSGYIKAYQEKKAAIEKDPQEALKKLVKEVREEFREIVLASGGEMLLKSSLRNAQQRIVMPYVNKEKQKLDTDKAISYIKDLVNHYSEQDSDESREAKYKILGNVADITYQTIQQKQAQVEAKEKAEKAREKQTPEREMKEAA